MPHVPVLPEECIKGLNIRPDGIYVDGTLGCGGHAREIVKRLESGRLIAIDRDADAIKEASELLSEYKDRITFVQGNFGDISEILNGNNVGLVNGMLFDLGVSSLQLDESERGFSYMKDAPLDMRMDRRDELTAFEAVNYWTEDKLRGIFFEYGEERYARQIAREIVRKRSLTSIETTFDLNEIIFSAIPAAARREAQHPSKRCFQALRMAVNDESGSLSRMLDSAPDRLKIGGRICVISFHSIDDRAVKRCFTSRANGCICPKNIPVCVCGITPSLKLITKKAINPGKDEVDRNPRARSGKLRVAERL